MGNFDSSFQTAFIFTNTKMGERKWNTTSGTTGEWLRPRGLEVGIWKTFIRISHAHVSWCLYVWDEWLLCAACWCKHVFEWPAHHVCTECAQLDVLSLQNAPSAWRRDLGATWVVCGCVENGVYVSEDQFPMALPTGQDRYQVGQG